MTNGEKLVKVFPDIELYKKMHGGIQIDFDSAWWNAEYKEPTTKNDCENCIHNKGVLECDMYGCKYEPTTKNDLGVDCISRADAIKGLGEQPYVWTDSDFEIQQLIDWKTHKEMLENLPSVTPQEPRWILVSERLPTKEEYIANNGLFIVSDGNRTYAEYFDVYNSMKYFGEPTMDGFRVDRCVIAWMPLPKAYREVEE